VGLQRPCRGQVCGGMLGAMARIAPPQPNEALARIAPRLVPQVNGKQQNFASPQLDSLGVDSRFETARSSWLDFLCSGCSRNLGAHHHAPPRSHQNPQFYVQRRSYFCRIPL
jgi:hypothetical protein